LSAGGRIGAGETIERTALNAGAVTKVETVVAAGADCRGVSIETSHAIRVTVDACARAKEPVGVA
jgi:hypothetical protein